MRAVMPHLSDCANLGDEVALANGVTIPCVGFGTYKNTDPAECLSSVREALAAGYRHVDTAQFYFNEENVGEAIRESGLPRNEIFLTTKVWNTSQGYDNTLRAFDESMGKLGLDYLDLYLVHWPVAKDYATDYPSAFTQTWRALEKLYADGKVRAIGVCNCLKEHLNVLFGECKVKPMVNQIEYHFGFSDPDQTEAADFSRANGIVVEAWAPLCRGRAFGNPVLKAVAEKYGKTEAQILVRWCLQHETLPLPKTVSPARIRENADVFGFVISDGDMAALDAVDTVGRLGPHPTEARF